MHREIKIYSHAAAGVFLSRNINEYHTIAIVNPGEEIPEDIIKYSTSCIKLSFHDIESPVDGCIMPKKEDINKVLIWSDNKEKILVTCNTGISRASALGYVISCKNIITTKCLVPIKHYPNRLIVHYGAELLNNNFVFMEYVKWLKEHNV